jgi:hypothetical protein
MASKFILTVARSSVDLAGLMGLGLIAYAFDFVNFLIGFSVLVFWSAKELQVLKLPFILRNQWPWSVSASIAWAFAALGSDWQTGGAGSRVLARLLGVLDLDSGLIIVHLLHLLLIGLLLGLLEFGLKRLVRGLLAARVRKILVDQ